jgi:catechol 2,3-dioxygenase-like lactoylglutathione lyase family enzyme
MYVEECSAIYLKRMNTMIAVTRRCSSERVGRYSFLRWISSLGDYFLYRVTLFLIVVTAPLSAQRPAITGISHVVFYADDMAQSVTFYEQLLGWKYVPGGGTNNAPRFYPNHAQYVELLPPPVAGQDHRLDLVGFATNDADGLRRFLAAKGLPVPDSVKTEPDGSRSFLVHDPEGNPVEFTEQGKKSPASPSPAALGRRLSTHIMHAGYVVKDRAALDHFYKDLLGFHLYWQGGAKEGDIDWVMMQVPDGSDWIEYMLYLPINPSRAALASADHIAPGVDSVASLQRHLEERGWKAQAGKNPQVLGVDGKLQLDLNDPDGTRIEFMEFRTTRTPCCSSFTGKPPTASTDW